MDGPAVAPIGEMPCLNLDDDHGLEVAQQQVRTTSVVSCLVFLRFSQFLVTNLRFAPRLSPPYPTATSAPNFSVPPNPPPPTLLPKPCRLHTRLPPLLPHNNAVVLPHPHTTLRPDLLLLLHLFLRLLNPIPLHTPVIRSNQATGCQGEPSADRGCGDSTKPSGGPLWADGGEEEDEEPAFRGERTEHESEPGRNARDRSTGEGEIKWFIVDS